MLNNVWTSLVNEVKATKKHYEELEATMMMTNNHLNNGISTLDARVDKGEDKHRTLHNVMEDVQATINKQQHLMYNMDKRISFYSSAVVNLEGKKAEEVKGHFDSWNNALLVKMTRSKFSSTVLLPLKKAIVTVGRVLRR